jgi:hypothetical protein
LLGWILLEFDQCLAVYSISPFQHRGIGDGQCKCIILHRFSGLHFFPLTLGMKYIFAAAAKKY